MPGHLGAVKRTVQNLEIVRVDAERQLLLIRGAVPGSKNGDLMVIPTKRAARAVPVKAAAAKPAGKAR
jgi:large subunit ribosomal protein L3